MAKKQNELSAEDRRLVLESLTTLRGIHQNRFIFNTLDRDQRDAKVSHLEKVMKRFLP